jgi:NAD(P)-dependent dehydrogenase (short-subunit alcohol dehydrogenase family)
MDATAAFPRRPSSLPCETRRVQSALVTGGSSGIGLAIARMLRDEGFALSLAARTPDKVATAASALQATAIVADVRSEEDCERLVAEHVACHGGLDVLVNSAGVGVGGGIDEQAVKQIDLQLDVNLRGLILVTRAALPHLRTARGLVVNLASITGVMPTASLPVYAATKAAVISLTGSLNERFEADGVRAHALCPAYVDTPMAAHTGLPSEELIQPADCAEVVRMLLRLSPSARVAQVVIERIGSRVG